MFRKSFRTNMIFVAATLVIGLTFSTFAKAQNLPSIPGVTEKDQYVHACVSCHKNYTDKNQDIRLSTLLKAWNEQVNPATLAKVQAIAPDGVTLKGKHSYKVSADANIPESCNKCHGKPAMKSALPMGQLLHTIHLTGGKDNRYLTEFQGQCTHCHKLDVKTGIWTVGNGNENEADK